MPLTSRWGVCAVLAVIASPNARSATPPNIPFCEVAAHAEKYVGRTISVVASYSPTLEETPALYDEHCPEGYILPLVKKSGSSLRNLEDYRPEGAALEGAFRIWGTFIGKLIKEKPLSDPYLAGDDGIHFQAADVQAVRALKASEGR